MVKAFFNPFPKCDILLNDMSEVFNSYILEERELPIGSMLGNIQNKLTHRFESKNREASEKWTGRLCPKMQKKVETYVEWAKNCTVLDAGQRVFKVKGLNNSYIVDLNTMCCDCKRWELSPFPGRLSL